MLAKWLYSDKSGCIWAKVAVLGKVLVFGRELLYSDKEVVFGQSGCIRAKVVVFGKTG